MFRLRAEETSDVGKSGGKSATVEGDDVAAGGRTRRRRHGRNLGVSTRRADDAFRPRRNRAKEWITAETHDARRARGAIAVFAQSGHGFSFDVVKRARNRSREAIVHQIHALEVFHLDQPRRRRAGKGVAL